MALRLIQVSFLRLVCRCQRFVFRHRLVVLFLSLLGLGFFIVQYKLLQSASSYLERQDDPRERVQTFLNVRDFVDNCAASGSDVIILDPRVLDAILNNQQTRNRTTSCRFLCKEQASTTFAVLENTWLEQETLGRLQSAGFEWIELKASDPRVGSNELNHKILVHYLFHRLGHVVHLVILHERSDQFLWFSRARFTHNQRKWLDEIDFDVLVLPLGEFDGALPMFQMSHVKIDTISMLAPKFPKKLLEELKNSRFVECAYSRADSYHQKYPRDTSQQAQIFRSKARKILLVAKRVLDNLNIPFWLSSGTCLGWYRQCDIIPYSQDVDLGIRIENYKSEIVTNLEDHGLHFHYKFGRLQDSLQLAFILEKVKLDIYFFYSEGNLMWNGGTHARTGNKFKYLFPKFTLCWTWFSEMLLRVPCEADAYVEANYGPDWGRPVKQWSWRESPRNIRANGQWPRDEWDDVIQAFE